MITCINKPTKFKNLTLNKEYDATEDGDNYVVTNDIGIQAKYAKRYFRVQPRIVDILDVLDIEWTSNESDGTLFAEIHILNHSHEIEFNVQRLNCCGIKEIIGLHAFKREIQPFFDALHGDRRIHAFNNDDLFREIFSSVLGELRSMINGACFIFSDSVDPTLPSYDDIISSFASYTYTGRNTNSGNNIHVWVILNAL